MSSSNGSKSLSDHRVYVISDLHLESRQPETVRLLLDFLSGPACRARALYILGDLFETWIGDDGADSVARKVAAALRQLSEQGTSVYFLHGNRDFLLGPDYCAAAGMQAVPEPFVMPGSQPATALMHGDSLCTDDRAYQRFRRRARDPAWQARLLAKPRWWRRLLARFARAVSQQQNRGKAPVIMDVNAASVHDCFRQLGVRRLIHGHTHRPATHHLAIDGQACERIVLGDWHGEQGSVVEILNDQARLLILRRSVHGVPELLSMELCSP